MELETELKKLREISKKNTERLYQIHEVSRSLSFTLDLNEILQALMDHALRLIPSEAGSILLVEDSTLSFRAARGRHARAIEKMALKIPLGQGLAGWVAEKRQAARVEDASKDPRFHAGIDKATGFKTRSLLCVPLLSGERVIGVLELVNKLESDIFQEEDHELLSAICQPASVAIENAHLYVEMMRHRDFQLSIFESMPGGFVGVNARGFVTNFNRRAAEILGPEAQAVVGQSYRQAFKAFEGIQGVIADAIERKKVTHRGEMQISVKGKMKRVGYSSLMIQGAPGVAQGAGVTFQDLSSLSP